MIGEDLIEQFQRDGAERIPSSVHGRTKWASCEAGIDPNLAP